MKGLAFGILSASTLLTGCSQASTSSVIKPALPAWVRFHSAAKPAVYYALTDIPVQHIGKSLQVIKTPSMLVPRGSGGWSTDIRDQKIEIRQIPGVHTTKAVAVKDASLAKYVQAAAQSTQPTFHAEQSVQQYYVKQKIHWVTNWVVLPSSLPQPVVHFIDGAGRKVGDSNPRILSAVTDVDEATHKPMYHILIAGTFHHGSHHARELPMIVLADGSGGAFIDPQDNTFNHIRLST